jgi:hypothetical protein
MNDPIYIDAEATAEIERLEKQRDSILNSMELLALSITDDTDPQTIAVAIRGLVKHGRRG